MEGKKIKNRWAVLFCICCNTFCFGGVYAWSAFSGELAEFMGWDYGKVTLAYSVMLMTIAIMGLVGGMLLQRFGARKLMIVAGIMWGIGWFLTGRATSLVMLYGCFGIMAGSGMAVGICGMASLIVAPLANFLLTKFDVMTAFQMIGGLFLLISLSTSWYIDGPPENWKPEGYEPKVKAAAGGGKTWREVLKDPRCYLLWATLLCASVAGLTAAQAALLVGIMAVANFVGRLVLGTLSDTVGRHQVVIGVMLLCALDMVFLANVSSFGGFVAAIVITGGCFGGTLATFSALSSDTFGPKYNGINYSIIFTGYGIASIVGPNMATSIKASTGSYSGAFIFAAVCSLIAAALCFSAKCLNKKMN